MSAICRVLAAAFLLIALASCDDDSADAAASESIFPDAFAQQREDCEADNGRWDTIANSGFFTCYRTLSDGNQTCRVASDCQGSCLARSRTCTPVEPLFGCHEILTDDGLRQTVCRQ